MGAGRWESTGRAMYNTTSLKATKAKSYREVYKSREMKSSLDPNGVALRESCDSAENPNSNAIIIALDITGSMGHIAHEIAKQGLGKLIEGILQRKPVVDPHIMFAAVGDVRYDSAPLQVSQFEADERIIQQLQEIYIESGGGGNDTESYDLIWYFAGTRTTIDCYKKRQHKGYLFTIGDEMPPAGLTKEHIRQVFGSDEQHGYSASELLKLAEEQYYVFHLIVEEGTFCRSRGRRNEVVNAWQQLMGKRAIPLSNHEHMPEVILSCIELSEAGKDADVEAIVESWQDKETRETVAHALLNEQNVQS